MERIVSSFAVTGRAKDKTAEPAGGLGGDDAQIEKLMSEMQRDMGAMDENNPDPRQLARMMRKMSAISGEEMPTHMNEMIRRMEAGEDPEKLETEYGDLLEEFDPSNGAPDGTAEGGRAGQKRKRRAPISRDPVLYDMAEYVD